MKVRILMGILTVGIGLVLPWWIFLIWIAFICYRYSPWLEGLAIGLFFDLVYSTSLIHFYNFEFMYTAIILILIGVMYFIKERFINV